GRSGPPPPTSPALIEMMLPPLRADLEAAGGYQYIEESPLTGRLHVFGGSGDPAVSPNDLVGWQVQTSGLFTLEMFPGGHFYLQTAEAQLLSRISELLAQI